ncbi:MAG: ROK family protein [Polyangiaceae bacterium]
MSMPSFPESPGRIHSEGAASPRLFGAIEGGGTKFVCAVGRGPDQIVEECRIATRTPESTSNDVIAFFAKHRIDALGVGMFGPLELRAGADNGTVLATPKPGWAGFHFRKYLEKHLSVPIVIDTDVNAAALGEARWGAAQGLNVVLYVTVGTGVGGGVLVEGRPLHGLMHAEFGHIPMPTLRDAEGLLDPFEGSCPYHGRCLEGLIAGPALLRRTGIKGEELNPDHEAFDWAARYLGVGLASAVLMLSPERIVVGGGVMGSARLLPKVRAAMSSALAGYVARPELTAARLDQYVVAPGLGSRSGIAGAFALAELGTTSTRGVQGLTVTDP